MAQPITYTCRICLEESNSRDSYISPCLCRGSALHVHRACLDTWRAQNPDGLNFRRCNSCHFEYVLANMQQDPLVEAQRVAAYKEAVAIDIVRVVFYAILIVVVLAFVLYWLDMTGLVPIRPWWAKRLYITNSIIGFTLISLGLLLLIVGVWSLFTLDESSWAVMDTGTLAMVGASPEIWLGMGIAMGLVGGVYNACRYLDSSRRKHRQRIWLHREAQIRQVRDFGDAGPPPARGTPRAASPVRDGSSPHSPLVV